MTLTCAAMAIGMPLEFEFFFLSSDGIVGIVKVFRLLLLLLYVFLSFFRKRIAMLKVVESM